MALAVWDDSYKTNNAKVDSQHQELFQMMEDLHDAIMEGKGEAVLTPTLDKLVRYTVEHFREEESLMKDVDYPARERHRLKHYTLTKEVSGIAEKYKRGEYVLTITIANFLTSWWRHHIQAEDKALIKYVQAQCSEREKELV